MAILKWTLRGLAGGCLLLAFPFLLITVATLFQRDIPPQDRDAAWGGILLGVPPAIAGVTLLVVAQQLPSTSKNKQEQALRQQFFQQLATHNQRITVFQWAQATGLSAAAAKEFLDQRAQEFEATFEAGDEGQVIYIFPR